MVKRRDGYDEGRVLHGFRPRCLRTVLPEARRQLDFREITAGTSRIKNFFFISKVFARPQRPRQGTNIPTQISCRRNWPYDNGHWKWEVMGKGGMLSQAQISRDTQSWKREKCISRLNSWFCLLVYCKNISVSKLFWKSSNIFVMYLKLQLNIYRTKKQIFVFVFFLFLFSISVTNL